LFKAEKTGNTMKAELEESAITSKDLEESIENLVLQPHENGGGVESAEASGDEQDLIHEEVTRSLGEEKRRMSNMSPDLSEVAEGGKDRVRSQGRIQETDEEEYQHDDTSDTGSVTNSVWSLDETPLDPEMVQLVKDRNREMGICTACQDLFASICTVGPDREGGEAKYPNLRGGSRPGTVWTKGYKPTLFHFAHDTLSALKESARDGCESCRVFLGSLEVYRNTKYHPPISEWVVAALCNARASETFHQWSIWLYPVKFEPDLERAEGYSLSLVPTYVVDDDTSRSRFAQLRRLSGKNYSSDDSLPATSPEIPRHSQDVLPLAKRWLNNCESNHLSCDVSGAGADASLPTRLIFVGENFPRLCLTSALTPSDSVKYAALSHCWGSLKDITRLTTANLDEFLTEIPPSALCKTFHDAIEITRALKLDFLWIDSICIIQDNFNDCKCGEKDPLSGPQLSHIALEYIVA
jgi:Heterokaryon incompatibility protein (HET)